MKEDIRDLIEDVIKSQPRIKSIKGEFIEPGRIDREFQAIKYYLNLHYPNGGKVALLLPYDYSYLLCILACMSSGHTFIPLNNTWPESRIHQIRDLASFDFLLDQVMFDQILSSYNGEKLDLNLKKIQPDDILYIIFTSGSTGEPKGVEISLKSYMSFLGWMDEYFHIEKHSKILFIAHYTFDFSLAEVGLFLIKQLEAYYTSFSNNYFKLASEIQDNKIEIVATVPFNLNMVLSELIAPRFDLKSLKHLLFCGTRFPYSLYEKVVNLKDVKTYNIYGPTEFTVFATSKLITGNSDLDLINHNVSIGVPMKGVECLLVDDKLKPITEAGEKGELLLSGDQLMVAYINRQDLTEKAIVKIGGKKYYRTGDICFFDKNSEFYVVGRNNDTLKRRGYRVDLEDIDSYLMKLDKVINSVTIAFPHEDYENILVSFIIVAEKNVKEEIINDAKSILVSYQMPDDMILLDAYPLNNSGKIDKLALFNNYKDKYVK